MHRTRDSPPFHDDTRPGQIKPPEAGSNHFSSALTEADGFRIVRKAPLPALFPPGASPAVIGQRTPPLSVRAALSTLSAGPLRGMRIARMVELARGRPKSWSSFARCTGVSTARISERVESIIARRRGKEDRR